MEEVSWAQIDEDALDVGAPTDLGDDEEEVRRLCAAILTDLGPATQGLDPIVREQAVERLWRVGVRVGESEGRLWGLVAIEEENLAYTEAQLAALAFLAVPLRMAPAPGGPRPRVAVEAFAREFAPEQGWSKEWLRRAVLGPLERDGFLRVVAPGQRRSDAYIEAGPRLGLLDLRTLRRSLRQMDAHLEESGSDAEGAVPAEERRLA